jgi:hypothetical protein
VIDHDAALAAALAYDASGDTASLPGLRWQRASQSPDRAN